jgi:3-methyladenine DNA glycosylase/8-oxoguanine DNA glycosylase
MLGYLAPRSVPGLETIASDRYLRRTLSATVTAEYDPAAQVLRCLVEGSADSRDIAARIERLFDPQWDAAAPARVLRRSPILRPRILNLPGLRIPGCWEPFELCLRVILGQQVTVKGADTLMRRLAAQCPGLTPDEVAAADLGKLGVPSRRIETIRMLAARVAGGEIRFANWPEAAASLARIPGIGPWTLEYLAIRLGRDPDAFPASDLGLLRAANVGKPADLLRMAEKWRPFRAHAAMYLWMAPG